MLFERKLKGERFVMGNGILEVRNQNGVWFNKYVIGTTYNMKLHNLQMNEIGKKNYTFQWHFHGEFPIKLYINILICMENGKMIGIS